MAPRTVLTILLFVGVANAVSRVSGGSDTSVETYPFAAQVEFYNDNVWSLSCAASILTSRYSLSAANCFSGIDFDIIHRRIRVGSTERSTGGLVFEVEAVRNHPNFGNDGLDADISLVRIDGVIEEWTDTIQPGYISAAGFVIPEGIPVNLIGWGNVDDETNAESLQEATLNTVNLDVCRELYEAVEDSPSQVTYNMLCVGGGEVTDGACSGDVGGPILYIQEPNPIIVGVVSWRNGCSNSTLPTVATAVTHYTDWIIYNAN